MVRERARVQEQVRASLLELELELERALGQVPVQEPVRGQQQPWGQWHHRNLGQP